MKLRNKIPAMLAIIFTLFLMISAAFAAAGDAWEPGRAWDSAGEVRRLNREAPSLDGFRDAEALIWLENSDFRMRNDGAMEYSSYRIIMIGETVPEALADIRIPVPYNGSVEIIDASWYNPMTAMKEGDLQVSEETLSGGASVKRINVPDNAAGRAVVLAIRETHHGRYGVDGAVALAGPLPRWEQNLTVEVIEGQEFTWTGRDVNDPLLSRDGAYVRYKWSVMNQEPWLGEGFVEYKKPFVAFGVKKGVDNALGIVEGVARSIKTPLPSFAINGDKTKNGLRLMSWIAEPSRTLQGYPKSWVRNVEQIPDEGPWTQWEQSLILGKWLQTLGWEAEIWWQAADGLREDAPATKDLFVAPVLRLNANGGSNKKVYYQAGQAADFGVTAPGINASTLFRTNSKDAVEKQTVGQGSASDHRLSMLWRLRLGENGIAEGTLEVQVTGGWTELFSGGQLPEKKNLGGFLLRRINFALPGMALEPKTVTQIRTGYKMDFNVRCAPGIIQGGSLLLRLPGGVPQRLGDMIGREDEYTFRFPFIIDQKVRIRLPGGYKLVQQPAIVNRGEGSKAVLKQSIIHWPKKAELEADSTWTVKTRNVDAALAILLKEELAAELRWPVLNLPFRK